MKLRELKIKNKTARIPIIQGGMGVGVSRFRLAGAVAKEGGVGMISSAQIGYDVRMQPACDRKACAACEGTGGRRFGRRECYDGA